MIWIGDSLESLREFPDDVQDEIGLPSFRPDWRTAYQGKADEGFGAAILELVSDHCGDMFRAVYTVRLAGRVYVLLVPEEVKRSDLKASLI